MTCLVIFVTPIFLHGLVSARLERTVLTAPIVFAAAGCVTRLAVPDAWVRGEHGDGGLFLAAAEIGLVLLLFTDASKTGLRVLAGIRGLPIRLLSTGMLLTLVLGAGAAVLVFPGFTVWEAGILAAILAPTDAGLGQVIVTSPRVPLKIRQALNVEAGLNDGLSVPFLLFFMALAGAGDGDGGTRLMRFVIEQLGYGALVGIGVGLVGGALLGRANRRGSIGHGWRMLAVVVLPLLCLLVSEEVGASMFIAAFVGGLAVQVGYPEAGEHSVEFTESFGQLLNLSIFFLFGMLVAAAWPQFEARHVAYAVLSLTVVRMLPVALATLGARLRPATVLFLGWFGPRGLASIVLGLVYLEHEVQLAGESTIVLAIMVTVLLSIFAHGLTAMPGMAAYARVIATLPPGAPELEGASPGPAPKA